MASVAGRAVSGTLVAGVVVAGTCGDAEPLPDRCFVRAGRLVLEPPGTDPAEAPPELMELGGLLSEGIPATVVEAEAGPGLERPFTVVAGEPGWRVLDP